MFKQKRVTKIKPFFKWRDIWIGVFIDANNSAVYICPLPTVGLKIWREDEACCHWCGKEAIKVAVVTGDWRGWALGWKCTNRDCSFNGNTIGHIEWPFGNRLMSTFDLRKLGYTVQHG